MAEILQYQQTTDAIMNIMLVALLGFVITVIAWFSSKTRKTSFIFGLSCIVCVVTLITTMLLGWGRNGVLDHMREDAGYVIYLDGEEVDRDKIDIRLYTHSYDDENKKIFLTNKRR